MGPQRHSLAVANYASHVRCYRFTSEIISFGITRATPELHSHRDPFVRYPDEIPRSFLFAKKNRVHADCPLRVS